MSAPDRLRTRLQPGLAGLLTSLLMLMALAISSPVVAIEPAASDPAWLEFAGPLMTAQELEVFLELEQQHQQSAFVERFWHARDPDPSTPRNELRQRWPDRLGVAEAEFGGVSADRGRAFLLNGPPSYILAELCPDVLRPIEVWFLGASEDRPEAPVRTLVFHADNADDEPRLWDPNSDTVADLFRTPLAPKASPHKELKKACRRADEVLAALETAVGRQALQPVGDSGWLSQFLDEVAAPGRVPLDGRLDFEFPEQWQGRTAVDGQLTIHGLSVDSGLGKAIMVVDGDIFRGERRADHFKYRFEPLPSGEDAPTKVSFRRYLDPGSYRILLTARDLTSKRLLQIEDKLRVPTSSPVAAVEVGASGRRTEDLEGETAFRIRPLPLGLLTGRQRVDVETSNEAVAAVIFMLDGRQVMKKGRPPYSVELDVGSRPRTHTIEAVALDFHGQEIARDSVDINTGHHRFAVRLLEPRQGASYRDRLRVRAEVEVSPDETLDHVEIFFNERRVASLFQPPFVQPHLALPERDAAGYVRAVAVLDDGNSAEDLVVVNSGSNIDRMRVDFVELFAGVVDRKDKPVSDLTVEDFSVFEDGKEQTIRRFETVRDLPINAGILLDTSESMLEEIHEAEEAALQFFENVLRPKDRAAVILFSDEPDLRVPLTNDLGRLASGLDGIEAGGETTLYDSVVFGLYHLLGRRGKKALVLLTDGLDSRSRYSFAETLEFARFSGVAIYSIGIGFDSLEIEAQRVLRKLASETGGDCYFVDSASDLGRIYSKIEDELRSQYLIGYQSSQSTLDEFRRIRLDVARQGVTVKTIPGYYP